MKNVTISLPEPVARWARVEAARRNLSVSRYVAELLRERMRESEDYVEAMDLYLSTQPRKLKESGAYPSRDEIHDRDLR